MGMRNAAAEGTPEPLDAVGIRVVRRRVDQNQVSTQLDEQVAQQERPLGRMDAQVVQQHQRDPSTYLRALDRTPKLGAEWSRPPTGRALPIEPALAPVNQAEAVFLDVGARRLDQPLAVTSLGAPDPA